jgi:antitoxin (DNA-binding transcriptional repressor) of toxin-antitoxin stability system
MAFRSWVNSDIEIHLKLILPLWTDFSMKTITMLYSRLHAEQIIAQVQKGQRMILTRRGKPVARLEPIMPKTLDVDDPFYSLDKLSSESGESLSNFHIDDILYRQ